MGKNKILMIQMAGCLVLGTVLGVAFWLFDGGRACKKVSDCSGEASSAQEMAFKNDWDKTRKIRELKELIRDYEYGSYCISIDRLHEIKDELHRLLSDSKPIKIYQGKWHKNYLEVIRK